VRERTHFGRFCSTPFASGPPASLVGRFLKSLFGRPDGGTISKSDMLLHNWGNTRLSLSMTGTSGGTHGFVILGLLCLLWDQSTPALTVKTIGPSVVAPSLTPPPILHPCCRRSQICHSVAGSVAFVLVLVGLVPTVRLLVRLAANLGDTTTWTVEVRPGPTSWSEVPFWKQAPHIPA